MPQAVVYNADANLDDYVAWAGGFTERANDKRIAIVHANGLVEFKGQGKVQPGIRYWFYLRLIAKPCNHLKISHKLFIKSL